MRSLPLLALLLLSCGHRGPAAAGGGGGAAPDLAIAALARDLGHVPTLEDAATIAARYAAACGKGWEAACAPSWTAEPKLAAAATALGPACDGGDPVACTVVAWSLVEVRPGVPGAEASDPARGAGLLRAACDAGLGQACVDLAALHRAGVGVGKDEAAAAALLDASCAGGFAEACVDLAVAKRAGAGVARDAAAAKGLAQGACDGGSLRGCSELGLLIGQEGRVEEAAALHGKACDGGEPIGCARLAEALRSGAGVARDPQQAVQKLERACQGDEPAGCAALADVVGRGEGVAKDLARGSALRAKACGLGSAAACGTGRTPASITAWEVDKAACDGGDQARCAVVAADATAAGRAPYEQAWGVGLLKAACDGGVPAACGTLGARHEVGLGVSKDFAEAARWHEKACDGDVMASCVRVAELYATGLGPAKSRAKAAALLQKPCDAGDAKACEAQRDNLLQGGLEGTIADGIPKALALYDKACDARDAAACARLAQIWLEGTTGRVDRKKSIDRLGDACGAGLETACYELVGFALAKGDVGPAAPGLLGTLGRRCDDNDDRACATLAALKRKGVKGLAKDLPGAVARAKQGCDAGGMQSCGVYGGLLAAGEGVARDRDGGLALLDQACAAKVDEACLEADKIRAKPKAAPTTAPTIYR